MNVQICFDRLAVPTLSKRYAALALASVTKMLISRGDTQNVPARIPNARRIGFRYFLDLWICVPEMFLIDT